MFDMTQFFNILLKQLSWSIFYNQNKRISYQQLYKFQMIGSKIYFMFNQNHNVVIYKHEKFKIPVLTHSKASKSVLISLAEYIVKEFPNLVPPQSRSHLKCKQMLLLTAWAQLLSDNVLHNSALRENNILYVKVEINQNYIQNLLDNGFYGQTYSNFQWFHCDSSISKQRDIKIKQQIFLLLCNPSSLVFNKPRIEVKALYLGLFFNNQNWTAFNILQGNLPSQQQMNKVNMIIVPGSNLSISQQNSNIQNLKIRLFKALKERPEIKYLGICFGMQLLAYIFNGKIEKAKKRIWKVQQLQLHKKRLLKYPHLQKLKIKRRIKLSQFHSDQVTSVCNQNFQVIAKSQSCQHEIIVSKNKRYLGFQGHPDYTIEFMKVYELRRDAFQGNSIQQPQSIETYDEHQPFRSCIEQLIQMA